MTKMMIFFVSVLLTSLLKKRPTNGKSPKIGSLSFTMVRFCILAPPNTMVAPSQILTAVVTF